jgi:hypothetical protein
LSDASTSQAPRREILSARSNVRVRTERKRPHHVFVPLVIAGLSNALLKDKKVEVSLRPLQVQGYCVLKACKGTTWDGVRYQVCSALRDDVGLPRGSSKVEGARQAISA